MAKAQWVLFECGVEGLLALDTDLVVSAVMHRGRGVHHDSRVAVLVVVVREEHLAERAGLFNGVETLGKGWAVLERLELRFGEGVVVRHVGT